MQHFLSFTRSEVALTALVVVPASALWIVTERFWVALLVGGSVYLAYQYGGQALRGQIKTHSFVQLYENLRAIRSRISKQA